jgi:hypothetical protein
VDKKTGSYKYPVSRQGSGFELSFSESEVHDKFGLRSGFVTGITRRLERIFLSKTALSKTGILTGSFSFVGRNGRSSSMGD